MTCVRARERFRFSERSLGYMVGLEFIDEIGWCRVLEEEDAAAFDAYRARSALTRVDRVTMF